MPGGRNFSPRLKTGKILDILGLSSALPDMMVMVAGKIKHVFVKKRLTILREDEFNEALKDHGSSIDIRQGHFEDVTVEHQCGLFWAFIMSNKFPQAGNKLA